MCIDRDDRRRGGGPWDGQSEDVTRQMQLANARFLRDELANDTWGVSPIMVQGYNAETAPAYHGRARILTPFGRDRQAFLSSVRIRMRCSPALGSRRAPAPRWGPRARRQNVHA
ncbi:hypothetical protein WME98_51310 [Sorangium sp. So ce296]|uniref:hypothetical protein n=1 Tax=Sorangium sp. So ce296 TaxID=3133296 RepID=UPI003F5EB65C